MDAFAQINSAKKLSQRTDIVLRSDVSFCKILNSAARHAVEIYRLLQNVGELRAVAFKLKTFELDQNIYLENFSQERSFY